MTTNLLGIDVGTSLIKACVIDENAKTLLEVERALPLSMPKAGVAEQNPSHMLASICAMLAEMAGRDPQAMGRVAAIGVSAQTAGSMAVDRKGEPLTPWFPSALDTRALPQLERMKAKAGPLLFASNGAWPFTVPRIKWWQETAPQAFARMARVPSLAGFIVGTLAGGGLDAMTIDVTSMTWYGAADLAKRGWNEALIHELGLPRSLLPDVKSSFTPVGKLSAVIARQTGLPAGIPLVNGIGDTAASLVGANVLTPGEVYSVNGSFTNYLVCLDRCLVDDSGGLYQPLASPLPDVWYALLYVAGGGLVHRQMAGLLSAEGKSPDYATLDALATHSPAGSNGLWHMPYALGRFCPPEPQATAGFHGMTLTHGRGDLWRAVLEGLTYDLHDLVAAITRRVEGWKPQVLRLTGGGAKSALWCQIQADMIGVGAERYRAAPSAPVGAALVAGVATGIFPDLRTQAAKIMVERQSFACDTARHESYKLLAKARHEVLDSLRPSWNRLASGGSALA